MESKYSYENVAGNLKIICENINESFEKYRSDDSKVDIMAVTKTVPPEVVNWVFEMGIDLIGENRVQEYLSKKDSYAAATDYGAPPRVHFIGHLQTNKVKYIINDVSMIQSVDSIRLAAEINRLAGANGRVMDILCEVNIGGELSKSGVAPDELMALLDEISTLPNIRVKGLMTIPPPSVSDVYFGRMQELFQDISCRNIPGIDMNVLSMGMTHDYAQAVKYGSTLVRIGTGLFGERIYK